MTLSPQPPIQPMRPRRWYDDDPVMLHWLEWLQTYPSQLQPLVPAWLQQVSQALAQQDQPHPPSSPLAHCHRWYDADLASAQLVQVLQVFTLAERRVWLTRFMAEAAPYLTPPPH